jgi:hypothetical protein
VSGDPLRVAVLCPEVDGSDVGRFACHLARELHACGVVPTLVTSHRGPPGRAMRDGVEVVRNWRPPDGRLRRRAFEEHLTQVPFSYLSLLRGDYDLAHALYPTDAVAAARWGARTGRPAVLSYLADPHRRELASRRLRASIALRAFAECSAVVVPSEAAADACERWLGVARPLVIAPSVGGDRHIELYRELGAGRERLAAAR